MKKQTATEMMDAAYKLRERDIRVRRITDAAVHAAMTDAGDFDLSRQGAHDLATAAVTLAMKMVYEGDAEIAALSHERDQYKAMVEKLSFLTPRPIVITADDHARSLRA